MPVERATCIWLAALAVLGLHVHAGEPKDLTDKLEKLGSPMEMAYGDKAKEKMGTSDLQLFGNKTYYGNELCQVKLVDDLVQVVAA